MIYSVFTTTTFDTEMEKLQKSEQERIEKLFPQLKNNPYVGDQLKFKFFREKRLSEKRIYYLVYDEFKIVLMVGISGKKDQQKTIDFISKYFDEFKEHVKNLAENN